MYNTQRPGVWDVMKQALFKPAGLPAWVAVDFALVDDKILRRFVEDLTRTMVERG